MGSQDPDTSEKGRSSHSSKSSSAENKPSKSGVDETSKSHESGDKSGHLPNGDGRTPQERLGLFHTWWLELCSVVIMIGSLGAVVGLLLPHKDRPQPDWPRHFSINSCISILVIVFKSAMLPFVTEGMCQLKWLWIREPRQVTDLAHFEDASRGPLGALQFLFAIHIRRSLVAWLGALIIVIAVAIDPFAQQIVHYDTCVFNGTLGSARLPRTNVFDGDSDWFLGSVSRKFGHASTGLKTWMTVGLYQPDYINTFLDLASNCPTSNCTFPDSFDTLGFCGSCIDVTDRLVVDISTYAYLTASGSQTARMYNITLLKANTTSSNTTSPVLTNFGGDNVYGGYPNIQSFLMTADPDNNNDLAIILATGAAPPITTNQTSGKIPIKPYWNGTNGYGAAKCSFVPCIRTFNATIANSTLIETQVNEPYYLNHTDSQQEKFQAAIKIPCLTAQDRQILQQAGYTLPSDNSTVWMAYNTSLGDSNGTYGALPSTNQSCVYRISTRDTNYMTNLIHDFINGNAYPLSTGQYYATTTVASYVFNDGNVTFNDVAEMLANVTSAMTQWIRQSGDGSGTSNTNTSVSVLGIAQHVDTCVRVYWKWMSYIAITAALALAFFIWMLVETRDASNWKSSIYPLLSERLWGETGCFDDEGRLMRAEQMEEIAKGMLAQIDLEDKGWKFTKMDKESD